MSKKAEAFLQFLKAARSLKDRGLNKEAIVQFAKNEFGELSEFFKKQIDSLFKSKKGIENIKIKDEVFDDTVIKLPIDDTGVPFNPKDPLKQYGKPKKEEGIKTIEGQMEKINNASNRLDELMKEREAMFKPKKTDDEIVQDLVDKKFGKGYFDTVEKPKKSRMLDEDEIAELDIDIGGLEYTNDFDGTVESANKLRKEHKQYIADMELEYKKGNLDPEPGSYTPQRKRFLEKKFEEMESSGDNRLMTRDEVEELASFDLQLDMDKAVEKSIKKDAKEKKIIKDFDPGDRDPNATGGRAGYYGGGQAMVEPDLSDIGHGSDALMARTRMTAPGSQATTSTGLNYLLGEDNDNIRVPFNEGLLVPKSKPYTPDMFEKDSMTLLQGMYGTGKDSNEFLYNEMIKKGNKLREQGVERETVIEIIRNNKDKINAFLETQTTSPKTLKGLADGGRIGFQDGLNFKKFYEKKLNKSIEKMLEKETEEDKNILEEGVKELNKKSLDKYTSIFETKPTRDKFSPGRLGDKEYELSLNEYYETEKGKKEQENEMFKMVEEFQTLKKNGIIDRNTPFKRFKKMKEQRLVKNKILELDIKYPEKEIINKETGTLNEENLKKAIDQAQVDLEISPIDGLTLKRSLNTEGEQSVTGGSFDLGNLNFSSDNIEGGKLTSKGNYTFGGVDLSGMIDSNDGEILNTELGFNYNNNLKGKMTESDGYRSGELKLDKNFKLPSKFTEASATSDGFDMIAPKIKNKKLKNIIDNLDVGLKGNYDITSFNGQTNISSDLTPKLSYNDGIFSADISKSILEGGDNVSLNAGASFPLFEKTFFGDLILDSDGSPTYNADGTLRRKSNTTKDKGVVTLKGTNLFTDNMGGTIGYKKNIFDKDNLKFSVGGEMDPFTGKKTGGVFLSSKFADGGIAGLRQGYSKGKGVDLARRGFLKVVGGTVGAIAALKTGALKLLGKTATTKAIPEVVKIAEGSGAPAWFEPMVNKVLADGLDITKKNATMDGQIVKSLDTPTGKVEVNYDTRSGNVDVNYSGENTAMGEGVDMRYVVGQADEGTKGVKPLDEFEAVESIPEGQMYSPDDYQVEFGENATGNVKDLYSDTSELSTLGGQKPLIKDISNSIKKKQTLKKMNENPDQFASDNLPDYDPTYYD